MKNIITKIIANRTLKYIKYLQKNNIDYLLDKENNAYYIKGATNEMIEAWQERPIGIIKNDKEGIYYKNKTYLLDKGE